MDEKRDKYEARAGRERERERETFSKRDVDADPRVFIQLSNLFNVCIHSALPRCALSRTQLGFNSARFTDKLVRVQRRCERLRFQPVETGLTPKDVEPAQVR